MTMQARAAAAELQPLTENEPKHYYVVRFAAQRAERFIEQCIERKIELLVPLETRRVRCGARATRAYTRGLLGPYGFVHFRCIGEEQHLEEMFDYIGLLRINDYFPLVHEAKVLLVMQAAAILAGRLSTDNPAGYALGDRVRIRAEKLITWPDGSKGFKVNAFGGFIGKIMRLPNSRRLRYVLETETALFGGNTLKIEVGADEIEPA